MDETFCFILEEVLFSTWSWTSFYRLKRNSSRTQQLRSVRSSAKVQKTGIKKLADIYRLYLTKWRYVLP